MTIPRWIVILFMLFLAAWVTFCWMEALIADQAQALAISAQNRLENNMDGYEEARRKIREMDARMFRLEVALEAERGYLGNCLAEGGR